MQNFSGNNWDTIIPSYFHTTAKNGFGGGSVASYSIDNILVDENKFSILFLEKIYPFGTTGSLNLLYDSNNVLNVFYDFGTQCFGMSFGTTRFFSNKIHAGTYFETSLFVTIDYDLNIYELYETELSFMGFSCGYYGTLVKESYGSLLNFLVLN